jgi:hypothetical protein
LETALPMFSKIAARLTKAHEQQHRA